MRIQGISIIWSLKLIRFHVKVSNGMRINDNDKNMYKYRIILTMKIKRTDLLFFFLLSQSWLTNNGNFYYFMFIVIIFIIIIHSF